MNTIETLLNEYINNLEDPNRTVFDAVTGEDVPAIRTDQLRAKLPQVVQAIEEEALLKTDKLCYSCGSNLFLYSGAYRCIYDGTYTTANISDTARSPKPDITEEQTE